MRMPNIKKIIHSVVFFYSPGIRFNPDYGRDFPDINYVNLKNY